jgi:hypothetical protein
MSLFIFKNNQQHGPYSIDEVNRWLSSGQLQRTDLACYEGATTWVPLSTLLGTGNYLPLAPQGAYVTGRPSSGWGFIITGGIFTLIGLLLCATLIGAIIGIPLLIAGIPMAIYGRILFQRRVMWDLKESVRVGVVQGMPTQGQLPARQYDERSRPSGPSTPVATFCSNCATRLDADAKFCPSCAAPVS